MPIAVVEKYKMYVVRFVVSSFVFFPDSSILPIDYLLYIGKTQVIIE